MEFSFKLSDYFSEEIIIIETSLLPKNFKGSAEKKSMCISMISEILDTMGEASAKAQHLLSPVTSAIKFNHSDHVIYVMVHLTNKTNGNVIGYLKMGWKNLFIFDLNGSYTKRQCFCCLDFYIHETRQRQGYGKKLYDFMLCDKGITAGTVPVDRPSDKFIKFLCKHYNLRTIIPQPNHFILYEQFFCDNSNWNDISSNKHSFRKLDQPFYRFDCK